MNWNSMGSADRPGWRPVSPRVRRRIPWYFYSLAGVPIGIASVHGVWEWIVVTVAVNLMMLSVEDDARD